MWLNLLETALYTVPTKPDASRSMYFLPPNVKASLETWSVNSSKSLACMLREEWTVAYLSLPWLPRSFLLKLKYQRLEMFDDPFWEIQSYALYLFVVLCLFGPTFPQVTSNLKSFSFDLIYILSSCFCLQNEWHKSCWGPDHLSNSKPKSLMTRTEFLTTYF